MRYPLLNILLFEKDSVFGTELKKLLLSAANRVRLCCEKDSIFEIFCNGHFNFCIFDIDILGDEGFYLIQRVREKDQFIPIIILNGRDNKADKQRAFGLGVDDYLVKPFDPDELLWRIRAVERRLNFSASEQSGQIITLGKFSFDFTHQLLKCEKKEQRLTRRESEVLRMLCKRKNQLVKRDEILMQLWGDVDYFHGRSLDVFISKLRRYLKNDPRLKIENIPTVGYILKEKISD